MIVVTKNGVERTNADVIEPNLLDMLPCPSDCTKQQREMAIGWYVSRDAKELGEYLRNTQQRIYREYYGKNAKKKLVGQKLHNLYAMRDMIHEAMRQKGVPTHGSPTLDRMIDRQRVATTTLPSGTSATSNFLTLDQIERVRTASRTAAMSAAADYAQ